MKFDGPSLARAWLGVFAAAGTSAKHDPALFFKTVAFEIHPTGLRLCATDQRIYLTAWVPDLDHHNDPIPLLEQAPDRVVVAADLDGRARSLLGYALTLANRYGEGDGELPAGMVPVTVDFDARHPADAGVTLEGLDFTYVVVAMPDVEKVFLPVAGHDFPGWRHLISGHQPEQTDRIRLHPEVVERLTRIRKHADGPLSWSFAGEQHAALVEYADSDPFIHGAVMPIIAANEDPTP